MKYLFVKVFLQIFIIHIFFVFIFSFKGEPTRMVADMLQMSIYGSTGTEALKNEINKIFEKLFEENSLLPGECSSIIRQALLELEDMYEYTGTEE